MRSAPIHAPTAYDSPLTMTLSRCSWAVLAQRSGCGRVDPQRADDDLNRGADRCGRERTDPMPPALLGHGRQVAHDDTSDVMGSVAARSTL